MCNGSSVATTQMSEQDRLLTVGVCGISNESTRYIYSILLLILFVVSSFENLVVIIVIIMYRTLHTPSILLFGFLAKVSLLNTCVVTATKARMTMDHAGTWDDIFWWMFAVLFTCLATILVLCLERFISMYCMRMSRYVQKSTITIIFLILCIAPAVVMINHSSNSESAIVSLALFSIYIVAIAVVITHMINRLRKQQATVQNITQQVIITCQWRAIETIAYTAVAFLLMNTPSFVYIGFGFVKWRSLALCVTTYTSAVLHSVVNPWIFVMRVSTVRKHVLKMFRAKGMIRNMLREETQNGTLRIANESPMVVTLLGFQVIQQRRY